jgi:hypothetical protein
MLASGPNDDDVRVAIANGAGDLAINERDRRDPSARHHRPSHGRPSAKHLSRTDGG